MTVEVDAAAPGEPDILGTLCCLFAAVVLIGAGYGIWDNVASDLYLLALGSSLLCYVAAFTLIVFGFTRSRHRTTAVVAGVALAFVVYAISYLLFKVRYYDSDALLFNSYSAQLFMNGVDPYTRSMQPGYRVFGVPEGEVTPTLNGGEVYSLSYPALSFLIYVPFLAMRISNLLWVSMAAHLLIMLMLVAIAPPRFKALAPFVLFLDSTYFEYTLGGITDVLWLPAGMLAAVYWHANPVAAAIWLGVACGFKQTPWLIVPFAGIYWLTRWRASRRFSEFYKPVLALAAAFTLPNLPFIVWHPHAWLAGVFTPLSAHLIVLGSGIAQLATAGLVPLTPSAFTAMTAFAACCTLALYVAFPKRLAFLPFLAPAIVFFFAARSLQNYFMYWPIVLVAYLFANAKRFFSEAQNEKAPSPRLAASLLVLGTAIFVPIVARPASPPLSVRIVGGTRNAISGRIDTLRVAVTNHSDEVSLVHFDVSEHGEDVSVQAWRPRKLQRLGAGAERIFTISAPSGDLQLKANGASDAQVIALDSKGRESVSQPVVFAGRAPKIHNADLAYWSYGCRPYPVAWQFQKADWYRGRIARTYVGGKTAVEMTASSSFDGLGGATLLEQLTDARPTTLRFLLYPHDDFRMRRSFFGAEVRDVVGKAVYYTIDHHRSAPTSYETGEGTINVLPGRLNAWNSIIVDLRDLRTRRGFVLSPSATMVVGALAVVEPGQVAATSGLFGGVQTLSIQTADTAELSPDEPIQGARTAGHAEDAPPPEQFVDDAASVGSDRFSYRGHWQHVRSHNDGRSGGTSSRSFRPGSSASLAFVGESVRLYGVRGVHGGRALITIDNDRTKHIVDFFSAEKEVHTLLFASACLTPGRHRLDIRVLKPAAAAARRRYVNIDEADVQS